MDSQDPPLFCRERKHIVMLQCRAEDTLDVRHRRDTSIGDAHLPLGVNIINNHLPCATIFETLGHLLLRHETQAGDNSAGTLALLHSMLLPASRDPPPDGELRRTCLPLACLRLRRLGDPTSMTTPHRVCGKRSLRGGSVTSTLT